MQHMSTPGGDEYAAGREIRFVSAPGPRPAAADGPGDVPEDDAAPPAAQSVVQNVSAGRDGIAVSGDAVIIRR